MKALKGGATNNQAVRALPLLPVRNAVLYPHLVINLSVGRSSSLAAVEAAVGSEEKLIIIVAQRNAITDSPTLNDLYRVGTKAIIKKVSRQKKQIEVVVQGLERVRMVAIVDFEPYLRVQVESYPLSRVATAEGEALRRSINEQLVRIQNLTDSQAAGSIIELINQFSHSIEQLYFIASVLNLDLEKEQALLEAPTELETLRLLYAFVTHELQVLQLRQKIATRAASEASKEQREYILRQQMRAIQRELGEDDDGRSEIKLLRDKLMKFQLPEVIQQETERELKRLEQLSPSAPDYQLTRSYLELIAELPWNIETTDNLDIGHARTVLDRDHFNLKEVKERILEHLAVLKLNPHAKSPILCFLGPPGVGKTSLGESIARALGRKFERMSLGGLHDEAELRGHRRTYIGAMPGRILQAIRRAGSKNPLLMLDEFDKVGRDFRGDPYAALMEILDPAQNVEFRDNYLNLPFDLSKVFFITTANALDPIPEALLDRTEVLRLSGYTEDEKVSIAESFLIPRRLTEAGLNQSQVSFPAETLLHIIRFYTREAGLRQLERNLAQISRKIAMRFAEGAPKPVSVNRDDLLDLLGAERFFLERARVSLPPGVATGLSWTEGGGDVLYIEATLLPAELKRLKLTGQLGKVMRESAEAALSYVWAHSSKLNIPQEVFRGSSIHIHVPAGAVPKDGPSAGITMATAIASLYSKRSVRSDTAMTGEITLTGLVLPVGGIREKVLAARRAEIQRVILPKANEKDLRDIPDNVRGDIEFLLVEQVDQAWDLAWAREIPELARRVG